MYTRFFRWAADRLEEDGILAFVSNSSFLHKGSFDGFRAVAETEFNEAWIIDLKGDARSSGETRRRQGGNVFGDSIKVGVAVYFFVKRSGRSGIRIFYDAVRDYADAEEKIEFIRARLSERQMQELRPDAKHNWLTFAANDFETFLPLATKETKNTKRVSQEQAIFKLFSLGVSTNRDEWLYDRDRASLAAKVRYLVAAYNDLPANTKEFPNTLKWSRNLKRRLASDRREPFLDERITRAIYRPYSHRWLYQSTVFTDELGLADELFPPGSENRGISFSAPGSRTDYCVLAVDGLADLHFGAAVDGYQQVTRYRFKDGERLDNVTDWGLAKFAAHYGESAGITKDGIFAYVYAVLHDPIYRETYAQNLKREFPRIPFYRDFARWREWGNVLLDLHIGYEAAAPFPLERIDVPDARVRATGEAPRPILKADQRIGNIQIDGETQLTGVPPAAWGYRLGNRSAIEWVLDQHKQRNPKDPTIRERFNGYRFADHKEHAIDLLRRVTTVSVETMAITEAMRKVER